MIGVGDLVVCVNLQPMRCLGAGFNVLHRGETCPRHGRAAKVTHVAPAINDDGSASQCGCLSISTDDGFSGIMKRYRKIRPDEHEPCEQEFRILLNLSKRRVKSGEPA